MKFALSVMTALLLLISCAAGQTTIPTPAVPTAIAPGMSFSIAAGAGFGQASPYPIGWGAFGVSPDGVNWVYTCPTLTAHTTSMELYYGRVLYASPTVTLTSLIGAGASTGTAGSPQTNVAGSYGAGGAVSVAAEKFTRIPNTSFVGVYKFQHSNISDPANPSASWGTSNFYFGVSWHSGK